VSANVNAGLYTSFSCFVFLIDPAETWAGNAELNAIKPDDRVTDFLHAFMTLMIFPL
jgi:hypothetical protein